MAAPPFKVKALYEYTSPHEDDLDFPVGQIITVTDEEDADWYMGEYADTSGETKQGLFPKNFVEKYEPERPPRPARPSRTKQAPAVAVPSDPPIETATPETVPESANTVVSPRKLPSKLQEHSAPTFPPAPASSQPAEPSVDTSSVSKGVPLPAEPPVSSKPVPEQASKSPPPAVAQKPSSFKDRIAAFNKAAAPPIAPFKPGSGSSGGGAFIKKPFVAPPPSKDAYVPPAREQPPPRLYRREEDPEIADRVAQDRDNAERAGVTGSGNGNEESDDNPKPTSLKDRIALLQKQQMEQASRRSDAAQKDKPKKPPKKRTDSYERRESGGAEDRVLDRVNSGDRGPRSSGDTPRDISGPETIVASVDREQHQERELFSDANDADQSAAGETTEDAGQSTGVDDDEEKLQSTRAAQAADVSALRIENRAASNDEGSQEGEDGEEDDEEEEEDEIDEEARRKMELRERMAKMSGGMGMAGMFGPIPTIPGGGSSAKKKPSTIRETPGAEASKSPPLSSPPQPAARVPMIPIPGMSSKGQADSGKSESATQRDGIVPASAEAVIPDEESDADEDVDDGKLQHSNRGAPPPVPKDRPMPPTPGIAERGHPPPVPGDRPAPLPPQSRPVPPPPTEPIQSPSAGSESDDEMPDQSADMASGADESFSTLSPRGPEERAPGAQSISSAHTAGYDRTPHSPAAKRSSYFGTESQVLGSSPPDTLDKRSSRPPPPIPGTPGARPPPPPPPIAAPPSRQPTQGNLSKRLVGHDGHEGETEYEGDYDTDIASGATHKDALKAHSREYSLDESTFADDKPVVPSQAPPLPSAAPRAVPPPPPQTAPSRKSTEGPRPVPHPPPPVPREGATGPEDEEYDPYRYGAPAPRGPPPAPNAPPPVPATAEVPSSGDEAYPAPPSRKSTEHTHVQPPTPARPVPPSHLVTQGSSTGPPRAQPSSSRTPARRSLEAERQTMAIRRSTDAPRSSSEQMYIANDVNLGESSQWWTVPDAPPPIFQSRKDVLFEVEESSTSKRGGKTTISKDVYVLFQDYSQTIVTARFDPKEPSDARLEQRHEPPPPRPRQDQLEDAHSRFGQRIAEDVASKQNTIVANGTPQSLVLESLRPFQSALLPVGTRSYGALVYANLANATVQQYDEIRPGDIVTFRNARFQGKHGPMHAKYSADVGKPEHVAVVLDWDGTKKKVRAWEQGRESKKVKVESFKVGDLRSGEVRVWRVMARNWVGWDDDNGARRSLPPKITVIAPGVELFQRKPRLQHHPYTPRPEKPMTFRLMPSALTFELTAKCSVTKARAATLQLHHGPVSLPVFMPVATQASLKGLTPEQLEETGCRLCLNNTYHLGLKPGQSTLDTIGGAHKFQSWPHNILTDSGGFQMVSLLKLANVTEEGVRFLSPHDGSAMLLTPEHSISLQNSIGSDIIMQLDDVIATTSPDLARMKEAMERSVRWLDRCISAHKFPERQNLFCIIQGGLNLDLRRLCCEEMVARDTPGIAIGGLSGGEAKDAYCKVVNTCTDLLPEKKPRYVMGVGYPEDLVVSVALGADMFDCVWPTRTARFGKAVTATGTLNLRHATFAEDFSPIESDCQCICCRPTSEGGLGITRAYICHLAAKETVGAHLLSIHNVHYLLHLMNSIRAAIVEDRYPQFVKRYFAQRYVEKEKYPSWAVQALQAVDVDLLAEDQEDLP